jgi:phosphoglycerate-specific signal transduction histidine kinase
MSLASIVLLLMITIGSAGEISIGCGTSISVSDESSVDGILTLDGTVMHSSGVITDLNIDPWVQNTNGDYAEVGVT